MKKKLPLLLLITSVISLPSFAEKTSDGAFKKEISENYKNIKEQICDQLDLTVNITTSPILYTDPEASCDLGFKMPGLPDFNLGFEGIDSCSLLKSITGDLVNKANKELRDGLNDGLGKIGLDDGIDIDLGDIVDDKGEDFGGIRPGGGR